METIKEYNAMIPDNIRHIMKEKCYKQSLIAKKAGYGVNAFADMMNGRKIIKPCDVLNIAGALEVDAGELFGRRTSR